MTPYLWNQAFSEKISQMFLTSIAQWVRDSIFKTNRVRFHFTPPLEFSHPPWSIRRHQSSDSGCSTTLFLSLTTFFLSFAGGCNAHTAVTPVQVTQQSRCCETFAFSYRQSTLKDAAQLIHIFSYTCKYVWLWGPLWQWGTSRVLFMLQWQREEDSGPSCLERWEWL